MDGRITALIGPSGCGKTTLLRCFNRVNERYGNVTTTGFGAACPLDRQAAT